MNYLSCKNTPFDNFNHLANNTATATEEYDNISKEITKEEFPAKIRALQITALAIVTLGTLVATTVSLIPGIILASLAIFPLIGAKYQLDRKNLALQQLFNAAYDIDVIFTQIVEYLEIHQNNKEDILITFFNRYSGTFNLSEEDKAKNEMKNFTYRFNNKSIRLGKPELDKQCEEYVKLIPLAESILSRKAPPTLHTGTWEKLRKSCFLFRYGAGSIYSSYIPTFKGTEEWSDHELYVKIEKDLKKLRWRAVKY